MRKIITLIIAATLTATLAGCAATAATTAATHAAAHTSPPPVTTPARAVGTHDHPYPAGTPGTFDPTSWSFTILATNGNAWAVIQPLDPSNTPPTTGTTYVLGTVKIDAAPAATPADPSSSVTYNYVGSDGNTYPTGTCGNLGDQDIHNANTMYPGATKTVLICAQVPTGAAPGGSWAVADNYVNSTTPTVFFHGA